MELTDIKRLFPAVKRRYKKKARRLYYLESKLRNLNFYIVPYEMRKKDYEELEALRKEVKILKRWLEYAKGRINNL